MGRDTVDVLSRCRLASGDTAEPLGLYRQTLLDFDPKLYDLDPA